MAKKLTAGILAGTAYKETQTVEWQGEQYEIEIRPLSNSEATQLEELQQEGITVRAVPGLGGKLNRQMNFDPKANLRGRKQADVLAVALGTTDPTITQEVVEKEFPPKIVTEVAARVREISGIAGIEQAQEIVDGTEDDAGGRE